MREVINIPPSLQTNRLSSTLYGRTGKVELGDTVSRVNDTSTAGLDYAAVLDLVCSAPRPVTVHFERKGRSGAGAARRGPEALAGAASAAGAEGRMQHEDWPGVNKALAMELKG